jgi:predicted lipoprotein with Yx(FWY)xxD motif
MSPQRIPRAGRSRLVLATTPLAAAAILATACGGGGTTNGGQGAGSAGGSAGGGAATTSSPPSSAPSSSSSAASSSAGAGRAVTVKTATAGKLGPVLVDESGRIVYLFVKDQGGTSSCYNACANVWPPVTTSGKPRAMGQAKPGKLGTAKRKDGKSQVTYAGHPLYYYAPDDHQPKSHKGQDITSFGAKWYVLAPQGNKVDKGGGTGGGGYGGGY